jgi:predicted kinase
MDLEETAMLISFAGLPGVGKSTLAKALAEATGAVFLHIDAIEQAIVESGLIAGSIDDAGYRAACAVAEGNLRLGRTVVADCVNDCLLSRDAWRVAARRAGARCLEVEVVCSDEAEHRRRVETRITDTPGLVKPTWAEVQARVYEPWDIAPLVVDTATEGAEASLARIRAAMDQISTGRLENT